MLSDPELFQKISAYDPHSLEVLYERYAPVLYTLIKKIVSNQATADKLLVDVFTIIWKKIDYFDFSNGNAYTWLIMLTRNKAIDYVRRSKLSDPVNEDVYDDNYENNFIIPHLATAEKFDLNKALDSKEDIDAALSRLTDAQKYVIHLAFYEGYTQKAIAGKLNIPLQTVKSKLQMALNNLKDNLNKTAEL